MLDALSGNIPEKVPVAIFTQSATAGQMDMCGASWPEAHTNPRLMARLGSAQADMFGFESVRVPFCMTGEAERLGCDVDLGVRGRMAAIVSRRQLLDPLNGEPDITIPDPHSYLSGRLETTIEAIGIMKRTHGDDYPVVAGAVAPFTLAGQAFGIEGLVISTITEPRMASKLADAMDVLQTEYVKALADAGADIVLMPDGVASPDLIDPLHYRRLVLPHYGCLRTGRVNSILHICGDSMGIVDDMRSSGADALSLEETQDPFELVERIGGRCALVGGVGPVSPLMNGTPAQVIEDAKRYERAGFNVVSPGCGICIGTPDANMSALAGFYDHHGP